MCGGESEIHQQLKGGAMKDIGKKLREIRESKGLTQLDVENSTGISRVYLSKIETDRRKGMGSEYRRGYKAGWQKGKDRVERLRQRIVTMSILRDSKDGIDKTKDLEYQRPLKKHRGFLGGVDNG